MKIGCSHMEPLSALPYIIFFLRKIILYSGITLQRLGHGNRRGIYGTSKESRADEDEGRLADNLSSRQLTAGAQLRFTNSRRIGRIADDWNNDLHNEISAGTSSNGDMENLSTGYTKKTNETETSQSPS
ncbi:hypothetical protein JTB14_028575 [Gonioctena quinquepunctata]|nr:hypothetical protein JTB14_028575 [Gonioctena quinquepunctata]